MKKSISSLACLTLLCLSAFADEGASSKKQAAPFEQGAPINTPQIPAAYAQAAGVKTVKGWDTFVTASFLYWDVFQEGMELGSVYDSLGSNNKLLGILEFSDEYKAGFKVSLGWNTPFDDWIVATNYTWFHHNLHKHNSSPSASNFFPRRVGIEGSSHRWDIDLDMIDLAVSRPCYQGTRVTLTPSFGLRGVLLNQKYTATVILPAGSFSTSMPRYAYGKTDSWAVGPYVSMEGDFLLGAGFRVTGSLAGTVTYTRYNGIHYFAQTITPAESDTNIRGSVENRVRAIGDAQAGMSWGMYLCDQRYHIDFSAMYEFQIFWNQNMIFWYADSLNYQTSGFSPGNLYFQGLTLSGTFDF